MTNDRFLLFVLSTYMKKWHLLRAWYDAPVLHSAVLLHVTYNKVSQAIFTWLFNALPPQSVSCLQTGTSHLFPAFHLRLVPCPAYDERAIIYHSRRSWGTALPRALQRQMTWAYPLQPHSGPLGEPQLSGLTLLPGWHTCESVLPTSLTKTAAFPCCKVV